MSTISVAVDGPAGSGKSTVCRQVAVNRNINYVDSGALYRAVTWFLLEEQGAIPDDREMEQVLETITIDQEFVPNIKEHDGICITRVNGTDVSLDLRSEKVAGSIGRVADNHKVRNFVNTLLRKWSLSRSIIMDGRDIGTVVLPDATLKIYLDASVEVRTERRVGEYREQGKNVDETQVKKQIILRDEQDMNRSFGALKKAEDAVYLDSSHMSREEVVHAIESHIDRIIT